MTKWVKLLTPARPAWAGLAGLAFATLPKWARRIYRLPGLPTTDLAATGALEAIRTGIVALPDNWTGPPQVREARAQIERRPAAAGADDGIAGRSGPPQRPSP